VYSLIGGRIADIEVTQNDVAMSIDQSRDYGFSL